MGYIVIVDYRTAWRAACRYLVYSLVQQEAQLSQRDRAMLRVIEYFAKSLKVIRNDTFEKGVS